MAPKSTLSVDVRMSTFCARKYSQNSLQIIMTEFPEFYYYIKLFSAHPQRRLIVCQPRLCHDLTPTEKGANPHHRLSHLSTFLVSIVNGRRVREIISNFIHSVHGSRTSHRWIITPFFVPKIRRHRNRIIILVINATT